MLLKFQRLCLLVLIGIFVNMPIAQNEDQSQIANITPMGECVSSGGNCTGGG